MTASFDVAVVGRVRDVGAIAAGTACMLASRSATRTALVLVAGERHPGMAMSCMPAARRLREWLQARDFDARACGRIVWTTVGDSEPAADAYSAAASLAVPLVLAVCGPREPWVEPLLEDAAIVLVAGEAEDPLTTLALAALDARGLVAAAVHAPAGFGAVLARTGLAAPSSWRAALPVATGAPA